jgi:quercetin dioxygenase-like cupin family protein
VYRLKYFLLLTACFIFLLYLNIQAQDTTQLDGKKFTIEYCVNEFDSSKIEKTQAGYQYWFVNKEFLDGRTLKLSVVGPHSATHPPHRHNEDEFFFVLEGTAEFYLNGETKTAGPYTSFYCPPNSEHGIRNIGDEELKYLVIKKYEIPGKGSSK